MKNIVTTYTFNHTNKTVTFGDYGTIIAERIMLVVDQTTNTILYNFADSTKGGTVATNVLTLTFDTTSGTYANTDKLLVVYDDFFPVTPRLVATSAGLTTATTAYTSGDVLGNEMSWTSAVRRTAGSAVIQSATLSDKAKVTGAVDLYLFDRASTPAADNAANSWADADMLNCLGVINFPAPIASALNSIAVVPYVGLGITPNITTLYGVLVTRSGHTFFGAAGDLQVALTVIQD